MQKNIQVSEQTKKAYVRPELTKQGKVEEMTQDHLVGCSKPIQP